MKTALWWLGYLNALPVTLIGLLVALFTLSKPRSIQEGAIICSAGPGAQWFFRWQKEVAAFTWGGVIFFADTINPYGPPIRLLWHELTHFKQVRKWGALFPFLNAFASLAAWASGGDFYEDNHFEKQAREEAKARTT